LVLSSHLIVMNPQTSSQNPNPKEDDVIDLTAGTGGPVTNEAETRVDIDDVTGKRLLIYKVDELPNQYGKGTYLRLHAIVETTGQKVYFPVPSRRGRDIIKRIGSLKAQIDQGKKVRTVIIRERCVYYRYTLGTVPYERAQRREGGRK
jgi:hypothetical protein